MLIATCHRSAGCPAALRTVFARLEQGCDKRLRKRLPLPDRKSAPWRRAPSRGVHEVLATDTAAASGFCALILAHQ
jgi:hypothetical protein